MSKIAGGTQTQFVLVQPTAASTWEDKSLGLSFRGRYAVVTLNERSECTSLYLGEGSALSYRGTILRAVSDTTIAASAEIDGAKSTVTAIAAAELTLPEGRRAVSTKPKPLAHSP